MTFLASLFVGKPLSILFVALCFAVAAWWLRPRAPAAPRRMRPLLVAAAAWAAYAAWEWLVVTRTPDADIRVDLLVIWPILLLISLWSVYRAIRPKPRPAKSTR